MTLSINISDATFTNFVAEVLPYYELANTFCLFGDTALKSTRNHVGSQGALSVIATPVYGSNFCTLSEANGFESPLIASGSPFTQIIVSTVASGNVGYSGNWLQSAGSTAQSNCLNSRNGSNLALAVDGNNRAQVAVSGTSFKFMAGAHDGKTAKVHVGAGGVLSTVSGAYVGGLTSKAKLRAGATGFGAGTFNAAAILSFNVALSDQQVLDVYGYLSRLLPTRGISMA